MYEGRGRSPVSVSFRRDHSPSTSINRGISSCEVFCRTSPKLVGEINRRNRVRGYVPKRRRHSSVCPSPSLTDLSGTRRETTPVSGHTGKRFHPSLGGIEHLLQVKQEQKPEKFMEGVTYYTYLTFDLLSFPSSLNQDFTN